MSEFRDYAEWDRHTAINEGYQYEHEAPPTGICPVCDGRKWIYYNGGKTTCDGCGGDGKNHYPSE
jgi:DnaJ-class molecular chaperone